MKNSISRLKIVILALSIVFVFDNVTFARTPGNRSYRRPSESDIEWLLGAGKPTSVEHSSSHPLTATSKESDDEKVENGGCRSNCSGLKNPACTCKRCSLSHDSKPLVAPPPPQSGLPKKKPVAAPTTLETSRSKSIDRQNDANQASSREIVQVSGKVRVDAGPGEADISDGTNDDSVESPSPPSIVSETEFENKPVIPPAPPKTTLSKIEEPSPESTVFQSEKPTSSSPVLDLPDSCCRRPCHRNRGNRVSPYAFPDPCSCGLCNGCDTSLGAGKRIGRFFQKATAFCRKQSDHSACCSCRHCIEYDHPNMSGDASWVAGRFVGYRSADRQTGLVFASPNALKSRLNIAENFNAEIRDRIWFDFRHTNNSVLLVENAGYDFIDRSKAVDQMTFGFEKRLLRFYSLELRVPIFNQFDSNTDPLHPGCSAAEFGNLALVHKILVARTAHFTFSGGLGITFPTAKDWTSVETDALLKNKSCHLVPYFGVQWHPNKRTFGHVLLQADIPVSKNELRHGIAATAVDEPSAIRFGMQLGRWLYRNELGSHACRLGGYLEIDYSAAMETGTQTALYRNENPFGDILFAGSYQGKSQSLNLAAGMPILFGRLTIAHAVMVPLTRNDRQFSVGYHFSVNRRF